MASNTVPTKAEADAYFQAREHLIREDWIRSEQMRIVKEELGKCYLAEGPNHFTVCKDLAETYLKMLRETRVRTFVVFCLRCPTALSVLRSPWFLSCPLVVLASADLHHSVGVVPDAVGTRGRGAAARDGAERLFPCLCLSTHLSSAGRALHVCRHAGAHVQKCPWASTGCVRGPSCPCTDLRAQSEARAGEGSQDR